MKIKFGIIVPKSMNIEAYVRGIENALYREGDEIERQYKKISDSFSDPAVYDKKLTRKIFRREMKVSTTNSRMVYLDQGTDIRWAVMSSDFSPKTKRGRISSVGGSGKAVIRGRAAMQARNIAPRPGIEARYFSATIRYRRSKKFPKIVQEEVNKAARGTFSGKTKRMLT